MPKYFETRIKPWTVYIWKYEKRIYAAGWAKKDGEHNQLYGVAIDIEKVPGFKAPTEKKFEEIARLAAKNELSNSLNAISLYGKKVLDPITGEISKERLKALEFDSALKAEHLSVDINKLRPLKTFPLKKISYDKALELGIG